MQFSRDELRNIHPSLHAIAVQHPTMGEIIDYVSTGEEDKALRIAKYTNAVSELQGAISKIQFMQSQLHKEKLEQYAERQGLRADDAIADLMKDLNTTLG